LPYSKNPVKISRYTNTALHSAEVPYFSELSYQTKFHYSKRMKHH